MNRIQISEGMGLDDFGLGLARAGNELGRVIQQSVQKVPPGTAWGRKGRKAWGRPPGTAWGYKPPVASTLVPAVAPPTAVYSPPPTALPPGWERVPVASAAAAAQAFARAKARKGLDDFEDDNSTPLVTIDEDVSLGDLATLEHLEYLESMGQLDDLGKSALKKLRKKVKKVVKKVGKVAKKVIKTVARATPLVMMAKGAKKVFTRKKERKAAQAARAEQRAYAAEEAAAAQEYAGITAAQWNAMTPTQQQALLAEYRAAVEAAESPAAAATMPGATPPAEPEYDTSYYSSAYGGGGGGAPSSAYWPVTDEGYPEEEYEEGGAPGLPSIAPKMLTEGEEEEEAPGVPAEKGIPLTTYLIIGGGVLAVGAVVYFGFIRK